MSDDLFAAGDPRPVHFMGIAGAGMSGLAAWCLERGVAVTGCDTGEPPEDLRHRGVVVARGHDPSHIVGVRAVVVTSAVPRDHPEVLAARAAGVPVIRRAEALGAAVNRGRVVAVAGTHGKTTTTVMTTEALGAAGLAPTGFAGGRVGAWGGNLRAGGTDVFVVEADEYDRSFLALRPTVAVITNVEADHLDIYRDLEDIRETFVQFASPSHTIVVCEDDPGAATLSFGSGAQLLRYGVTSNLVRVRGTPTPLADGRTAVAVEYDGECLGDVVLRVPGMHNVRNALAAIAAGLALGATVDGMRAGLEAFGGVERRFQRLGNAGGVTVIDDYAHHPTEVAATLEAARGAYPNQRIVAAFQPHLYTRTRDFAAEFAASLATADAVFLCDLYPAREQPIPGVTSDLVAAGIPGDRLCWQGPRSALGASLAAFVAAGDVVLTMGAGDITRSGPELLSLIRQREEPA
jgi:UDP-N-acetylmuramate--alanine ligase